MAVPENKKNSSLEELDALTRTDRISPIQFEEPELKSFDASSVFEVKETEKPKRTIFGKRSNKPSTVAIRQDLYEEAQPETETANAQNAALPRGVIHEEMVWSDHPDVAPAVTELKYQSQPSRMEKQMAMEEKPAEDEETEDTIKIRPEPDKETAEKQIETLENAHPIYEFEEEEEEEDGEEDWEDGVEEEEEEDDEAVEEDDQEDEDEYYQDPDADLYEDKKRFLLSQYPIIEDYLAEQAREGYHFVKHIGKKYYFTQGEPADYYFSICYFKDEPDSDQWRQWEKAGWQLVSKAPGKKKKDAGWFIFRHPSEEGEYKKTIDNEVEKYRFFRKYANSCRSTMFLIFICMACCLVMAFLQYQFQGYLWSICVCLALFVISLVIFLQYARMLRHAKKRARMLQAKLRIQQAQQKRLDDDEYNVSESEADLESDWDTLDTGKRKRK